MATNHRLLLSALNSSYALWPSANDACAYCGVQADTYDHVPPLSMVHALGRTHFEQSGIKLWRVPACRECNCLLGKCPHHTITKRKQVIKGKLRQRYAKYLRSAHWTGEELEELGHNLRVLIESGYSIGEWARRRIAW